MNDDLTNRIEQLLKKKEGKARTLQFAVRLPFLGIDYSYSNTRQDQRFHSASVGKLMTATLIFMAIEQGKFDLRTQARAVLAPGLLDHLLVFEGHDYQEEVTVEHLLGHTSGVNDYFESKTLDGSFFLDGVLKEPDRLWTPTDLLDFTRDRQQAAGRPGETFLYSDTGYVLLGLIVERAFQKPFHQALADLIFKPAGMDQTTLCFTGEDFDPAALAPLFVNGVDVHNFKSLSCDFSGGGLSTTAHDLILFLEGLNGGLFISQASLGRMADFSHRYRPGLHYGLGMMQVRFGEFFFLLKNLPQLQGHLGVTGVHAWHDPETHASFVLNVGDTKAMEMSFRLLISIVQTVGRALDQASRRGQ
jgi:D-alanyl-D-alanine carboxypeptidase